MNKSTKTSIAIIGVSVIAAAGIMISAPHSPYAQELAKLQVDLAKVNNESNKLTDSSDSSSSSSSSQSSLLQQTVLSQTDKKATDLMKNLYNWSSSKEYNANKQAIIKNDVSDAKLIDSIMPDDKDKSGNSQIDALSIHSTFKTVKTFSNQLNNGDVYLITTATATKSSDSSSDNEPLSNNHVYKAHFDPQSQKFTAITYVGKESLTNSTGVDNQ